MRTGHRQGVLGGPRVHSGFVFGFPDIAQGGLVLGFAGMDVSDGMENLAVEPLDLGKRLEDGGGARAGTVGFWFVNHGFRGGDNLPPEFAQRICSARRGGELVGGSGEKARAVVSNPGGDEGGRLLIIG